MKNKSMELKMLIFPQEVVALTSEENLEIDQSRVTRQIILAIQNRYIRPALGDALYAAIINGSYSEMVNFYIKPAMALYIARSLTYNNMVRVGVGGIAIPIPENHVKAASSEIAVLMNSLKKTADIMLRLALEHIITSKLYPEFSIVKSLINRVSTLGGVVII